MKLDLRDREHEKIGAYAERIAVIKELRGVVDENALLKITKGDKNILDRIIYFIDNDPDCDDLDIAEKILDETE
ncbi:MAG: hypothetical protein IJ736_13890 [Firmicutes bacterium]|nr:hypothetical protein [Bacillota bacterium]